MNQTIINHKYKVERPLLQMLNGVRDTEVRWSLVPRLKNSRSKVAFGPIVKPFPGTTFEQNCTNLSSK